MYLNGYKQLWGELDTRHEFYDDRLNKYVSQVRSMNS